MSNTGYMEIYAFRFLAIKRKLVFYDYLALVWLKKLTKKFLIYCAKSYIKNVMFFFHFFVFYFL